MRRFKKTYSIFFLTVLMALILGGFCLAQEEKSLEVDYPQIPGAETPTDIRTPLPDYVKYIFNLSILVAGLVAFFALIYGGIKYLTSGGNPAAMGDARDQIFAGILGLIILISSYVILTTINPQLVILKANLEPAPPAEDMPGVYLCKDSSLEECITYNNSTDSFTDDMDNNIEYIHFENPSGVSYGAVLHEDRGRQGKCGVYLSDGSVNFEASSLTVFQQGSGGGGNGVTLYEAKEYNKECGLECYQTCPAINERCGDNCVWWSGGKCWGPYTSTPSTMTMSGDDTRSIKINGNYLAVLSSKDNLGKCQVFTTSYEYLRGTYIGVTNIKEIIVLPIK